ncbi:hypothetical protein [Malaciobacter pacificus]|uniref:Lipoprotein n=1 Tax=Malaciobacter pacificus TaxID=1080223 RepID=A0A5C2H9P3_9BACT|nr:hypothetical protein [Malaciobacter pacificus]QEP35543.1 hypothetical protein APAC_2489 [Malaciobacter pacificus]
MTIFLFTSCTSKQIVSSSSATILIKTPNMKFYDKGFIYKYEHYTQVQIFSAGTVVLDMKIYDDRICSSTFRCQDFKTFNKENLHSSYKENFIKELFEKNDKEILYRDKAHGILIKILKD